MQSYTEIGLNMESTKVSPKSSIKIMVGVLLVLHPSLNSTATCTSFSYFGSSLVSPLLYKSNFTAKIGIMVGRVGCVQEYFNIRDKRKRGINFGY